MFIPDLAPGAFFRTELTIQRSRFIVSVGHADSPEKAKAFIEQIRAEFPDATHHCSAFNAGQAKSTTQIGASDDGEPHGTAGRPMLNVLIHADLGETVVVVTRYYGGILLGTGGLVKAYQTLTQLGLEGVQRKEKRDTITISVQLAYRFSEAFLYELPQFEAQIIQKDYTDEVLLTIALPKEKIELLEKKVLNMTSGNANVTKPADID